MVKVPAIAGLCPVTTARLTRTVFQLWRFDEMTCKSTCVRAYRHDSRKEKKQKTDEEYYADLETFVGGQYIEAIIIDPRLHRSRKQSADTVNSVCVTQTTACLTVSA